VIDLRARTYDARDGRFTSRDPVSPVPGSTGSPYVYAGNDPLNSADPLGTLAFAFSVPGQVTRLAAPAAAQSPASAATASATTMLAAAAGGDRTTLHNAAARSASIALTAQIAVRLGPVAAVAGMHLEDEITGASKKGTGKPGRADILFEHKITANVWEVKSATIPGAQNQATAEALYYIGFYKTLHPGIIVTPGEPMAVPVGVIGFPTYEVSSPGRNTGGAILYQEVKGPRIPPPIPVPVRQAQPRQVRSPVRAPVSLPVPGPVPSPVLGHIIEGVVVAIAVVVVVAAFASGVGEVAAGVAAVAGALASVF
jgi:hypothetical protein